MPTNTAAWIEAKQAKLEVKMKYIYETTMGK